MPSGNVWHRKGLLTLNSGNRLYEQCTDPARTADPGHTPPLPQCYGQRRHPRHPRPPPRRHSVLPTPLLVEQEASPASARPRPSPGRPGAAGGLFELLLQALPLWHYDTKFCSLLLAKP